MSNNTLDVLRELYQKIECWGKEQAKRALFDSNQFNPFQFLASDEMGLSKVIAFFLDPKETHGQNDLFLNSFLKKLNLYSFLAYQTVNVEVEKSTSLSRRHDIYLTGYIKNNPEWIISIENKLRNAVDQPKQLEDYWKDIDGDKQEKRFLLYLPSTKKDPSVDSIPLEKWKNFKQQHKAAVWGADDIIEWLEQTPIVSPQMQQFVGYFIKFIKEELLGMSENSSQLIQEILDDKKLTVSAIEIAKIIDSVYEALSLKLVEQVKQLFEEKNYQNWSIEEDHEDTTDPFWFVPKNKDFCIFLYRADESSSWRTGITWNWEVEREEQPREKYKESFNQIKSDLGTKGNQDVPVWQYLKEDKWDSETWASIPDGRLAKSIFEQMDVFIQEVNKRGLDK